MSLYPNQRTDRQLLKELKKSPNHDKIISNATTLRYRIPLPLFKTIIEKVVEHHGKLQPRKDLVIIDNDDLEFDDKIREIQDYQDRDAVYLELDVMGEIDYEDYSDSYERFLDSRYDEF